jgi:membrane protein
MAENVKKPQNKLTLWIEKILGGSYYNEKPGFKGTIQKILRILVGSVQKFLVDEGLLRAASISYSLVVSFVPIMVVGLLVTAKIIDKEKYFVFAREFIKNHSIPIDPEPYFNILNELLNNANAVTGIGFLVMLFSATSVLRNFEDAVNKIWKVRKGRTFFKKISGFLLVLIFGPVLVTIGFSMAQKVIRIAAAPAIIDFVENRKSTAIGEKALFLEYENEKWQPKNILSKVDFETHKETILINSTANTIIEGEEKSALLAKIYRPVKNDLKIKSFNSYAVSGSKSWIVTDNGCILMSFNQEKTWNIQCYQFENIKLLFKLQFNKIIMIDNDNGFIIGNKGLILNTSDGGKSWKPAFVKDLTSDLVDFLAVDNENYFIVGEKFALYNSNDKGKSWKAVSSIDHLAGKDKPDFTRTREFNNKIWITGDYGSLLESGDNGKTWEQQNPGITPFQYNDVFFKNKKNGILIGEKALIRTTEDGGKTWIPVKPNSEENLNRIFYLAESDSLFVSGEEYVILKSQENNFTKFIVIQDSPLARTVLYAFGNIILPFIFIGIIFFIIYKVLPYTEVNNKAAFYGAAVTSFIWVIFLSFFKMYVSSFSDGTFAIYGTLAAIPLLLLLVYTSASIMLFGAEVGFFVQNPGLLRVSKTSLKIDDDKRQIWHGLKMLHTLFINFDQGKGSTPESDLVKICHNDYAEFIFTIEKFMEQGIIELTEKKKYTPVISPETVMMKDLLSELDPVEYHVPDTDYDMEFKTRVEK